MLPKDILKHAEKVKDVEAEVLKVLSAKPTAPMSQQWELGGPILRAANLQMAQAQAQLTGQQMDQQARQLEQLYMAGPPLRQSPWGLTLGD